MEKLEIYIKNAKDILASNSKSLKAAQAIFDQYGVNNAAELPEEAWEKLPTFYSATSIMDAKRALNVVAPAAQALSEEEKKKLVAIPIYCNDLRSCKDIKEKYGLSWNELRTVRGFLWKNLSRSQ